MKIDELVKLGNCAVCGRKQLDSDLPLFYAIEISRHRFDGAAVKRAAGLELQIGALARVMGPGEDLTITMHEPKRVFVHETCADKVSHLIEFF
jgi:hypothetical protein